MNTFIVRITETEVRQKILQLQDFDLGGLNRFKERIEINDLVFIYLGGDTGKVEWVPGFWGFGRIIKTPFHFDDKNFSITIHPIRMLPNAIPIKEGKLHSIYRETLFEEAPYVGANHFPTQAISEVGQNGANALWLMLEEKDSAFTRYVPSAARLYFNSLQQIIKNSRIETVYFIQRKFIEWFQLETNFKTSYDGLVTEKILSFWDREFFDNKLFVIDIDDYATSIENIRKIISEKKSDSPWNLYNQATSKGSPQAVLGESNYLKFLDEFFQEEKNRGEFQNLIIIETRRSSLSLPKPFLLLAGISGTGKTRFVLEQARASNGSDSDNYLKPDNYELVAVRPDWHEPSDLLGYISRIGGERYIPTSFLSFLVKAWVEIFSQGGTLSSVGPNTRPFWLCLDEMNLAPVEQYFADYLSILESRKWKNGEYSSLPLISTNLELVRESLVDLADDPVWDAFKVNEGIPLPPNLIVAGTVNMDETTHGFSRKVIDRALTLDFQEFFPNDYDAFFAGQKEPKLFGFSIITEAGASDLPGIDKDEIKDKSKSVEFLKEINKILQNTPFELAYRALNELLLSVVCYKPESKEEMFAVWDDFLMQKVLPRIEGDSQKLKFVGVADPESEDLKELGKGSILHQLYSQLEKKWLKDIWSGEIRPDLLRDTKDPIECRSKKKLLWMMKRLKANHFTDFWV